MLCITSNIGVIPASTFLDLDIKIPKGIPTTTQTSVATEIIAMVDIVSSHMPK